MLKKNESPRIYVLQNLFVMSIINNNIYKIEFYIYVVH